MGLFERGAQGIKDAITGKPKQTADVVDAPKQKPKPKRKTSPYRELPSDFEYQKLEYIRSKEEEILSAFFEKPIKVPPVPAEITAARLEKWERQGFELHYLPAEDMSKNRHLKEWKNQPDFTKHMGAFRIPEDVMILKGGWVLVDTRPKPAHGTADQSHMYQDDILAPALEELRYKGMIKFCKYPSSRFNISPGELENPIVRSAIAKAYGVRPDQITIQKVIEFNVIGNIHHPEWGEPPSTCYEWFGDRYYDYEFRFFGGDCYDGGLSYIHRGARDDRDYNIGFRILVRLTP